MTSKPIPAYHRTPFETALTVAVLDVGEGEGGAWVLTDDTILFPGGGGQPPDEGTLAGARVAAVARVDGGWRHELAAASPPLERGPAELVLDWRRRFDHMQQHTAQHLLSALAQDRWGWATTAFHLGADRSDIELDTPSLARDRVAELEEAVMAAVREARPLATRHVSVAEYEALGTRSRGLPDGHEGDVRLVEIDGIDLTACGGTHLASTAQIEAVKLIATEGMRGGTRLHWVAGRRLRERLMAHEERSEALRRVLGTADEQLVQQAEAKLEQLKQAERRANDLLTDLASEAAGRVARAGGDVLEAHFEGRDAAFLKAVTHHLQERLGARAALLTCEADGAAAFVLVTGPDATLDVRAAGQAVAEALQGRGGGAGRIFQGRAGSLAGRDAAVRALASSVGEHAGPG